MAREHAQDDTTSAVHESVLREHRELMTLVTELAERAAAPTDEPARWTDRVGELLGQLRPVLSRHFHAEEEGPFAREFPAKFPHLANRLDELMKEHLALLRQVDGLLDAATAAPKGDGTGGAEPAAVISGIRDFVEAIRLHETAENELLQDAFLEDIGGSG
jgi:hypothetical protein